MKILDVASGPHISYTFLIAVPIAVIAIIILLILAIVLINKNRY